jgi:glyceraldehyde-3-phosphate dehydrogenase type I
MSTPLRVGINGLGRIGGAVLRLSLDRDDLQVVAANDLAPADQLAYCLSYDSVHGRLGTRIQAAGAGLKIGDRELPLYSQRDPADVPWADHQVDLVLECTGFFTDRDKAAAHLRDGVQRVLVSGPSKDADGMFVPWVNTDEFDPAQHRVVSMASCTTNCVAPVAKTLHDAFGIENMLLTTVHAYTSTQALIDRPSKKARRGRAAAVSIVPTSTGAAKATAKVIPALAGRLDGMAFRVPIPDGSIVDMVVRLERDASVDAIHDALRAASEGPLAGVLGLSEDPLVSADIVGDDRSSIVDLPSTMAMGARTFKILSWYDNEIGYSTRLLDFAAFMSKRAG